jgi:hypothetical protein
MELHYEYFKDAARRRQRMREIAQYIETMNAKARAAAEYSISRINDAALVATRYGFFRVGSGNSKVFFPTVNFESGLTCSSAETCPYSFITKRQADTGKPLCYAQKIEGAYKNTLFAKAYQAEVCSAIAEVADPSEQLEIARHVVDAIRVTGGNDVKFVRVSEVGDIGPAVSDFACRVLSTVVAAGLRPYLYTKRPPQERHMLASTGAVVLVSDDDFVCVPDEAAARGVGLPVCPGECGGPVHKCYRCPLGKKTAVVAH